jgi:hypothetical protein
MIQDPDSVDLALGLGESEAGHRQGPKGKFADEPTPIHQSITSSVQERRGAVFS